MKNRSVVWLCAACKTGSTWLSAILDDALHWEVMSIAGVDGRRAQEVSVHSRFINFNGDIFLPHTHTLATDSTARAISRFNIKPVVLSRSLPDTLVSLDDHLCNWGVYVPTGFVPPCYTTWEVNRRKSFLISLVAPWYISFYVSWLHHQERGLSRVWFLTYESLVKDTPGSIEKLLRGLNVHRTTDQVNKSIEVANSSATRYNVGQLNRGLTFFNDLERQQLLSLIEVTGPLYNQRLKSLLWPDYANIKTEIKSDTQAEDPSAQCIATIT